ncbi:MAG TPA: hypothetical protein VNX65_02645 [Patescibacteria group bacterium]|jgi:hypothetical protein|nr:hypothetical protein [Patescibacteria group bacterium]
MQDEPHQTVTSDNDELAKVLAGIGGTKDSHPKMSAVESAGLQFEETPAPGKPVDEPQELSPTPAFSSYVAPSSAYSAAPAPAAIATPPLPPVNNIPASDQSLPPADAELGTLKKSALEELRPLVKKLNLPPDEKFDILLLIIRSTDDKSLLAPAHEAAKQISDEGRRAQALLDIIKEVDYFGGQK